MILKNHSTISKKRVNSKITKILGLFALLVLLFTCFYSLVDNSKEEEGVVLKDSDFTLIGDAESIHEGFLVVGDFKSPWPQQQSSDFFLNGKHSIKLQSPQSPYGFSYSFQDMMLGDQLTVRVWMYSPDNKPGCLAIRSTEKENAFYVQSNTPISHHGPWQLLQTTLKLDRPIKDNLLKAYCFNNSQSPIYFDDISFFRNQKPIKTWQPKKLHLILNDGQVAKLEQKRAEALDQGMLLTTDDSWVKGFIAPEGKNQEKTSVSLRLKGDWLDHLKGDKWSFRIKTPSDKAWNRLKTFSIQDPLTRSYMKEWLLHQLFDYEDVLTTRYDFVDLTINNESKGLYVYEEHFMKQIPEFNLRREGPILKFSETGLWEARLNAKKFGVTFEIAREHKANPDVAAFEEKKIQNTPNLAAQYKIAQNLCYEYQYGLKDGKDIFDLDLFAKYFAIMDLSGGHHGAIWHNQRFYYNPVIGKLEPIGFDGYDEYGATWVAYPFLGYNFSVEDGQRKNWHIQLFMDPDFLEKYIFYLYKFSQKEYLYKFLLAQKEALRDRLIYLKTALPQYSFSVDYLFTRASEIQEALTPNSASVQTRTIEPGLVAVCNRHGVPVQIVGTSITQKGMISKLDSTHCVYTTVSFDIPNFSHQISVSENAKFLIYRIYGLDSLYYASINPWPIPTAYTPMQELAGNLEETHDAYYYDKTNKIVLFKDSAVISKPIIIPQNHRVKLEAGTHLNIINHAFLISYSAVEFMGEEEAPILIHSSDGTANGITVLQAKNKSTVNYTTFSNLNTLAYKGWNLTGAVTFYESDVDIRKSIFTKNNCEDALNIIRSTFLFENSTVSQTFADGFDADFCKGLVKHSYFYKTGNDGIDFSSSDISIEDCTIENVGDKGISIGEEGIAKISNTTIDGAVIGIASKDFSKVTVHSATLKNCEQGFSAYQKKPEYGGAYLFVENYSGENLNTVYKIFPGSYLKLLGKEITGD